jgi:head-tail adaptor
MRTGKQRLEATIQSVASTQDTIGGEVKTPSTATATWYCELVHVNGGEVFRGRQVHGSANYAAIGQYVAGVTTKHRLVIGARTFEILACNNVDARDRELRLDLLERGV